MEIKNEVLLRAYLVFLIMAVAALFILGKTAKISIVEGDTWRGRGDDLYRKYMPIQAERGNILAENGQLLAVSIPFFEIRMDLNPHPEYGKLFNGKVDSLALCLATHVDRSHTVGGYREKLIQARKRGDRYLLIKENVSYDQLALMRTFPIFRKGKNRGGFIAIKHETRINPFGKIGARTIGYVSEDTKRGLEGYFDEYLAGEQGMQLMQRIVPQSWIPVTDLSEIEPKKGLDIQTTLDTEIQDITHEALMKAIKNHDAEWGCAVVMEVKTGAIKAISNIGKYRGNLGEYYNYAIGEAIEPGSTFKLATIMALMEDGLIELDDTIDLNKGVSRYYDEDMLDASAHGLNETSIRHAFEISSNVGISQLAQLHYGDGQANKWTNRLKQFLLDQKVGIEIHGESSPYIKAPYSKEEQWSGTTVPWMSIGYETEFTPLQMLNLYNSVANDGIMMKPYLVSAIKDKNHVVKKFNPKVLKYRIAKRKTIENAKELLEGVVENGTAKRIKSDHYSIACKTGTARIQYNQGKRHQMKRYRASLAGYFPADKPKYSCIVVVHNPKRHGYYGSDVAAPVFKEIADKSIAIKLIENKRSEPDSETIANRDHSLPGGLNVAFREDVEKVLYYAHQEFEKNTDSDWTVVQPKSDSLFLNSRLIVEEGVPNVVGMGLKDALFLLENNGLKVQLKGSGKVKKQSIKPGTPARGQVVSLMLG